MRPQQRYIQTRPLGQADLPAAAGAVVGSIVNCAIIYFVVKAAVKAARR